MKLTEEEQAMRGGEFGPARQWAINHQIAVGSFFDAGDFVPVGYAHIMADTEATGEAGVAFLEGIAALPESERRVYVPTITDPRASTSALRSIGFRAGSFDGLVPLLNLSQLKGRKLV